MVVNENKGFLIDLLKLTLGEKYKLNFRLYPLQRAVKNFKEGKCDLLASAMENVFEPAPGKAPYLELPTGMQDHYTIFSHNRKLISKAFDKQGLKTKKKLNIIKVRSWHVPEFLLKGNKIYEVSNVGTAAKMLTAKRADYFIGFNYLVRSFLRKKKVKSIKVVEGIKFDERNIVFVVNQPLASKIGPTYQASYQKILKTGRYKQLLEKYSVPAWLLLEKNKARFSSAK